MHKAKQSHYARCASGSFFSATNRRSPYCHSRLVATAPAAILPPPKRLLPHGAPYKPANHNAYGNRSIAGKTLLAGASAPSPTPHVVASASAPVALYPQWGTTILLASSGLPHNVKTAAR